MKGISPFSVCCRLDERKMRRKENLFKAEGTKCVMDTLGAFDLRVLYATQEWLDAHIASLPADAAPDRCIAVKRGELHKLSSLSTPPDVVAVYDIPSRHLSASEMARKGVVIALDGIQDPGNLGTIIRVADWFGFHNFICSRETADCFSPKVVQATMGSISRAHLLYGDLPELITEITAAGGAKTDVFGTYMDGESLSELPRLGSGIVVVGNEGRGISPEVSAVVNRRITIPAAPAEPGQGHPESLNAAIATSIILARISGTI